ncbi:MAG: YncE family protein [Chloroflexi bacterium]|nr:YncE family protein [Chloroflexota bacterium]
MFDLRQLRTGASRLPTLGARLRLWVALALTANVLATGLLLSSTHATPAPIAPVVACPVVSTFPAGPLPSASAPVALAVDSVRGRVYVAHNQEFVINQLPTNRVSVVDQATGSIVTTIAVGNTPKGIAVDATRNLVYVTNFNDNTVSIISGASNTVVSTTAVGGNPQGVAVDPSAGLVYIANTTGNSVTVLDAATGAVNRTIPLGGGAYSVAVDTTTHLAYVAVHAGTWSVVPVRGQTGTVQAAIPLSLLFSIKGIAVNPGRLVYVSDHDTGRVAIIDISVTPPRETDFSRFFGGTYPDALALDSVTGTLFVPDNGSNQVRVFDSMGTQRAAIITLRLPSAVAVDETSRRTYVANQGSDSLTVINTDTRAFVKTIVLGTFDPGLALDATNGRLYAANFPADAVSVIALAGRTVETSWLSGPGPWAVAVDPAVKQLYSLNYEEGTMSILDTTTGQVKGKVNVGPLPLAVTVNPATRMVYVTSTSNNTLTVLNGATNSVAATLTLGSKPVGIAIDQTAGRIYVANQLAGTISVIDAAANVVIATWTLPTGFNNVWGLAVDPTLRRLYATLPPNLIGDFTGLAVLNADTGALITQIPTPGRAALVAVNPVTHQVFMTDSSNNTVSIIDGASNTTVATVTVGNSPNSVVVDQNTGLAYVGNAADGTVSVIEPCPPATATPTPTPTSTPTPTPVAPATATPTATTFPAATPTNTVTPVSTPTVGGPAVSPTVTPTPSPGVTAAPTATPMPTTPTPGIGNGGFENEGGWTLISIGRTDTTARTGIWSLVSTPGASGRFYQVVTIPGNALSATLTFYWKVMNPDFTGDTCNDYLQVKVMDASLSRLIGYGRSVYCTSLDWRLATIDFSEIISSISGQAISIVFEIQQDTLPPNAVFYVDDVAFVVDVGGVSSNQVQLSGGWNLISMPGALTDPSVAAVFAQAPSVTRVYYSDRGNWVYAFRAGDGWTGPLTQILDGRGYWVYVVAPSVLTLNLAPPVSNPAYILSEGWNMIGFTTTRANTPVGQYIAALAGKWIRLYRYDQVFGWELAAPGGVGFSQMEWGRGYWIFLNEAGTLAP